MKTRLLALTAFLYSIGMFAQTEKTPKSDTKSIKLSDIQTMTSNECNCGDFDFIYDFKCGAFYRMVDATHVEKINDLTILKTKYKKGFRFKVINVNKYLNSVKFSYDDVFLQTNEPDLFKKFFLGEAFDFTPATSNPLYASGQTKSDSLSGSKKFKGFVEKLNAFKDEYNTEVIKTFDTNSACPTNIPCCNGTAALKVKFLSLSKKLAELKQAFNELESENAVSLENAEAEQKSSKEKPEKGKTAQNPYVSILSNMKETSLNTLKVRQLQIQKFKTQLDNFDDEKLMELLQFVNNIVADNFEYNSPTIFPTGDQLFLKLEINANDTEAAKKQPIKNGWFDLSLPVANKWFFSFSTGPFVGLSSNFKTQDYGWQKQPNTSGEIADDSKYKLVKAGKEGLPVGIAGYANFGTKLNDYYGLGISIGAGATIIDDPKPAYFAGVTNFFGQEKQFNLTAGISFIQVSELKKELYSDIGTQLYDAPADLKYTKKFISGWFVSLSYSIFTSSNVKRGEFSSGVSKSDSPSSAETPAKTPTDATSTDGTKQADAKAKAAEPILKDAKKVKIKYNN